jgi:hypothetical protein
MQMSGVGAYLSLSHAPASAAKLKEEVRKRERWSEEHAAQSIQAAVEAGEIFVWPRFRGAVRYWNREPGAVVREAVLTIASQSALPRKELVARTAKQAYNCGKAAAEAAIKEMLGSGALKSARTMGPGALFYAESEALVRGSMTILSARLSQLGITLEPQVAAPPAAQHTEPAPQRIFETLGRLQPGDAVPVTVHRLRAELPDLDKDTFDRAVIELADQQRVYLTTHDHGWALPEPERRQLVSDGGQKLYVAVTLRD